MTVSCRTKLKLSAIWDVEIRICSTRAALQLGSRPSHGFVLAAKAWRAALVATERSEQAKTDLECQVQILESGVALKLPYVPADK